VRTLSSLQEDFLKTSQLFSRAVGDADVELSYFGCCDSAGVRERGGDGEEGVEEVGVSAGDNRGRGWVGGEGGVGGDGRAEVG